MRQTTDVHSSPEPASFAKRDVLIITSSCDYIVQKGWSQIEGEDVEYPFKEESGLPL